MQTDAKNVKFLKPLDGGVFTMPDPETDDGIIFRPNFEVSWLDNAKWHDDVVGFVRRKAHFFTPAFTEKMMEAKTDADILERIGSNFKGWAAAYSKEKRRVEAGGAGDPTNRRKGRKIRVFMSSCCCPSYTHDSYRNSINVKRFAMSSRCMGRNGIFSFSRHTSPPMRQTARTIWIPIVMKRRLISK